MYFDWINREGAESLIGLFLYVILLFSVIRHWHVGIDK